MKTTEKPKIAVTKKDSGFMFILCKYTDRLSELVCGCKILGI